MKANLEHAKLSRCETVFEIPSECSVETDLTMPDYCPEIKKILKSSVNINSITVQNNSDHISMHADALVRIVYVGDNGEISAYEQMNKIEKRVDTVVSSECLITATLSTDYINTRAVNQRKVEVKASISVKFKAVKKRTENILCKAEGGGIQAKTSNFNFASVSGLSDKTFSLSETVEIEKNKGAVKRIMNTSPYVCISDVKVINNKALIKGNCRVVIHYISEESNAVECAEYSLPVSQIVEVEGIGEQSKVNLNLNICSCEAVSRVDASGEMRLIDLNLKLTAVISGYEETKISLINDCYSTLHEIKTSSKKIEILEYCDSFDTTFLNKVVLESIGVSLNSVVAVWCSDLKYSFSLSGNKCLLNGTYNVTVIYYDSENQFGVIQKPVDFENELALKSYPERVCVNGCAQLLGCSCAITGDSRIELKSEIAVRCTVLSSKNVEYISEFEIEETQEKNKDNCALTIYFCNAGESIWEIAKRYNTTPQAIKEENSIEDEVFNASTMLLIPSV